MSFGSVMTAAGEGSTNRPSLRAFLPWRGLRTTTGRGHTKFSTGAVREFTDRVSGHHAVASASVTKPS